MIAGIFYGASKQKAYELLEASHKEEKEKLRAERAAKLKEERRVASERDIEQIVALFSPKPTPKFTVEEQSYQNTIINEDSKTCIPETKIDVLGTPGPTSSDSKNDDASAHSEECDMFSQSLDLRSKAVRANADVNNDDSGLSIENTECLDEGRNSG